MADDELVPVFTTHDAQLAQIIRGALIDEGIDAFVESPLQGGLTGTLKVRLHVPARDAERAREFIESRQKE